MTTTAATPLPAPSRTAGYLMAASGAALFSTKAIFIKLAYLDQPNATLMLAYRMIFALPMFAAIGAWACVMRRRRGLSLPGPQEVAPAMVTGFLGYYVASYFDFAGLQYISAQLERLVLFSYPIIIMFLSAVLFGERLTRHGLAAAAVTYTGLAVAFLTDLPAGGGNTVLGTMLVLGAALAFALHQIFAKRVIANLGSMLYTAVSMTTAAVFCIAHHVLLGNGFVATSRFLWMAAGCALFATVLPALLINASLARISSTSVAMISTLSPVVTIALAVMILAEPFTFADALGSALVIAGVWLYTRGSPSAGAAGEILDVNEQSGVRRR